MSSSAVPQKLNVRNMISIFENQSVTVTGESTKLQLKRAQSLGNVSNTYVIKAPRLVIPSHHQDKERNLELAQIDQQIQHLKKTLKNYKTYSREAHIYYQNQIFFLLTDIVNVETNNEPKVVHEKSELMELMKRLNKDLNALLPQVGQKKAKDEVDSKAVTVPELKTPTREASLEPKVQESVPEVETPVSVRSLKQFFEKNSVVQNGEVKEAKLARYNTFNSAADVKYIPYSQRFKSTTQVELQPVTVSLHQQNSEEVTSVRTNDEKFYSSVHVETQEEIVEKEPEEITRNASSSTSESSLEDSESEESAKEEERS